MTGFTMYEYRLLDDGDSLWVFNVNLTCHSLKGILFFVER